MYQTDKDQRLGNHSPGDVIQKHTNIADNNRLAESQWKAKLI